MVRYKEYIAKDLFIVKSNPQLNKESFSFIKMPKEGYPYFTRTVENNGIAGYVKYLDEEHKIKGNSIAVGMLGMRFFYMKSDFYAGQFTKTVYPKFSEFNEKIAQYFITYFNKNANIYKGVLVRDFDKIFYKTIISVPVNKNDKIDFTYIEKYIDTFENNCIKEVNFYLQENKLNNSLNDKENNAIKRFEDNKIIYQKFKIKNLFIVS